MSDRALGAADAGGFVFALGKFVGAIAGVVAGGFGVAVAIFTPPAGPVGAEVPFRAGLPRVPVGARGEQ